MTKDPACEKGIIYAVLVGSVVVVMVSLSYSRNRVVPYDKFRRIMMLQDLSVTCGLYCQVCYRKMLNILNDITPFTLQLTNAYQSYLLYSQSNLGRMTKIKPQTTNITFDDVAGADSAKAELLEIVACINGDGKYKKLGAKAPKGVLLAGPPGTGKTLLARAVAGEAGVLFFCLSRSELVEVFVGVGAARIRDIFQEARKISPAIIFIDEIDAIGGKRGNTLNCEHEQTLNQLLTEMDGFEKDDGTVVVIAATNRPESLDPALMRPGRLSRKVFVGAPDEDGRRKIFALYLRNVLMNENKEAVANLVALRTPGLTGAGLEEIANESVRLAVRRDGDFVTSDDVLQAIDKFKAENDICQ